MTPIARMIFASRWLQLPLYLGLIVAQAIYVYRFWVELAHLLMAAAGDSGAVHDLYCAVHALHGCAATADAPLPAALDETLLMLSVLGLIDVVMISNLLIMVIVGGYETFVSRLRLEGHPDEPEWLSHVNATVLKVKLATAIIGISSIHLLKTFIDAANQAPATVLAQAGIHLTLLLSALAIAACDRILARAQQSHVPAAAH